MRRNTYLLLLLILLAPSAAFANGVSPILNFFHKDTWIPASIVTLIIILVEASLVRWRIKQISIVKTLWISFAINTASSTIGSLLLIAYGRNSFFMWDTMSLVLPLFFITLTVEIPLLHTMLRKLSIPWLRTCSLVAGMNVVSYIVIFVVEFSMLFIWISYAGHLDKRDLAEWQNPKLLNQVTGTIYATEPRGGLNYGLRSFNPQEGKWVSLSNCPPIDPQKWDVNDRILAYASYPNNEWTNTHLVITHLPDFALLHTIGLDQLVDHKFDNLVEWQGITDLALSPDSKHLAILLKYSDAVAYKSKSSYYALGGRCRLVVIDVESGRSIASAPRWASESGLCWLADSLTVLFPSFDNEKLYETMKSEVCGNTGHALDFSQETILHQSIFAFNNGGVTRFSNGRAPSLAVLTGQILVRDGVVLRMLDSSGQEKSSINVTRLAYLGAVISPDGSLILARLNGHSPFYSRWTTSLVDISAPNVKHILPGDFSYKYDWSDGFVSSNHAQDKLTQGDKRRD